MAGCRTTVAGGDRLTPGAGAAYEMPTGRKYFLGMALTCCPIPKILVGMATGHAKFIKPVHPDGVELRFNWNAAIAQDPFNEETLYYGSQFVHKSTDKGDNWTLLSPDLTTNDPEKQKQLESGGLTYDVTQAENHTTILAIAPSTLEAGVIWVGTDDGNLQLTRDNGKTWTNLASRLPGLPAGSWIPQIRPSAYNPAEAFVVANDYRRDNWEPYLFHTTDYGKTWKNLVSEDDIWGYCLSFAQDVKEPKLMFLGTEFGLYISFDGANSWQKWTHGYPTVSTIDMEIHPLEHDLVIGTFGRAAYVLDDIRPLREIATKGNQILEAPIHVFDAPDAFLAEYRQATGTRFSADAIYAGENRRPGAMLSYIVALDDSSNQKEKVTVEILDAEQQVIRTFTHQPDTGLNRIYWDLDRKGFRYPYQPKPKKDEDEPGGMAVMPGKYLVRMTFNGATDTTGVAVFKDPRIPIKAEEMEALNRLREQEMQLISLVTEAMDRLREAQKSITIVSQQIPENDTTFKALQYLGKSMKDTISSLMERVTGPEDLQGIVRRPDNVQAKVFQAVRYLGDLYRTPNSTHHLVIAQMHEAIDTYLEEVNAFFTDEWESYKREVEKASLSPFSAKYAPLKRE